MSSRIKILVFATSILYFITSDGCNSPTPPPTNQEPHPLVGKWNWIESWVSGGRITPESVGYSAQIAFSNENVYSYFENDTLISESDYRLRRGYIDWLSDTVDIISLKSMRGDWYDAWAATYRGKDTLVTDALELASGESIYLRIGK